MIILIGPSASGKTSIAKELIKNYNFKKFVTNTTRAPREGEVDGEDYHFISVEKFLEKQKKNELIEYVNYNNNYYGTSIEEVSDDKVLIVDIKGANKFYERLKSDVVIFYVSCSKKVVEDRMRGRGDSEDTIKSRLELDDKYFDIKLLSHYDYIIDNDSADIDAVTKDVYTKYMNKKRGNV